MAEAKAKVDGGKVNPMFIFRPEALVPEQDKNKNPTEILEEQRESLKRWEEQKDEVSEDEVEKETSARMSDLQTAATEKGKSVKEVQDAKKQEEKLRESLKQEVKAAKQENK